MNTVTRIGVGFDTARYGHHVTFLRDDLQPAAKAFHFTENAAGYQQVQQALAQLAQRHAEVHFHIRIDAAGQYACNLEAFLRRLPHAKTVSVGEPERNQHYCKSLNPKRKADPVESLAMARFALVENPRATPEVSPDMLALREIASRLEGQTRQATRLANQLHNLLARVFPEFMLIAKDIQAAWVLRLLSKYPTAEHIARAKPDSLTAIPHLNADKAQRLQEAARQSLGVLRGDVARALVANLVRSLQQSQAAEEELRDLLIEQYCALATPNQIDTIIGIGSATAAILTAKIMDIARFDTLNQLVNYFGVFPEENTSGIDKQGRPKAGHRPVMSRKGNDLVRKYLWLAAGSACQHNPAVRALHGRLTARGVAGGVALGHCMRKLLALVFAVWKSGKPFDPKHYPWENPPRRQEEAAGHSQGTSPAEKVVTAAAVTVSDATTAVKTPAPATIDFATLRAQVSFEQVLAQAGLLDTLRGSGPQRRGRCPLHAQPGEPGRTFSVNLRQGVFQCFAANCGAHGDVLDFWAALRGLSVREAALDLAARAALTEPEKRNR